MNNDLLSYLNALSNDPDDSIPQDLILPISQRLLFVYHLRQDLQQAFPLNTRKGRQEFLFWYLRCGANEHNFLQLSPEQYEILNEPAENITQDCIIPFTRGLMFIYSIREDLQKTFNLDTNKGRKEFLCWWLVCGVNEHSFLKLTPKQLMLFTAPDDSVVQDQALPLTKGLIHYFYCSADLQKNYNLNTPADRKKLLDWYIANQNTLFPFLSESKKVETPEISTSPHVIKENGVNIIGFPRGELGIGEDVRMAALALDSAAIPFSVYEAPLSLGSRSESNELTSKIEKSPIYKTNLICLPGPITFLVATKPHIDCFSGHYNIGAWQWELPHWPKKWDVLFLMIDEIWAFSRYAENMFKQSTHKPVIYMPMCVEYKPTHATPREKLKLPKNTFLFLTMFDGYSSLSRKNPLASVYAFLKAFPKNKDVALVIKAMNAKEDNSDWQKIINLASQDERLYILNETFSRNEVMGLIQTCDAYVSLHRAEGFGRILAESLLLKKAVITTNFSGNTDFCTTETAFMVNGPLVPIKPNEYADWENQFWCDPDIDEAAKQMIRCYENADLRANLAENGHKCIQNNYSAKTVGDHYISRLKALSAI